MKAVIQRVSSASLSVSGNLHSKMGKGFLILLGVQAGDQKSDADNLAKKCSNLRIFEDENSKMNLSLKDVNGEILCVSQFTLLASCKKGNRPSFFDAEEPSKGEQLYNYFLSSLERQSKVKVMQGQFGEDMQVALVNDGPVTILLDSKDL